MGVADAGDSGDVSLVTGSSANTGTGGNISITVGSGAAAGGSYQVVGSHSSGDDGELMSLTSGSSSGGAGGAASFISGLLSFSAGGALTLQSGHGIFQPEAQFIWLVVVALPLLGARDNANQSFYDSCTTKV